MRSSAWRPIACKAAGPVLIGRRSLPRHVQPVVDLLAPVMLIALVDCADVRWRRGDRGRRARRRRGRSCDCDRAARARHRRDGDRRAGDCARPSRCLGATRGRSAVPEHGGRRDRLGDEAGEPDHEHPLSKVPHTRTVFRRHAAAVDLEAALLRRAQHGERVGHLEQAGAEPVELGRSAAGGAVRAAPADGLDRAAAQEDPLEVRRGDLVAERGLVDVAELGERERFGREREADVRVRELPAQAIASGEDDRAVVEGGLGQRVDRGASACRRERGDRARAGRARDTRSPAPSARGGEPDRSTSRAARGARPRARRPSSRGGGGSSARASRRRRACRRAAPRRPSTARGRAPTGAR